MDLTIWILVGAVGLLFLLNVYQFLVQRSALRMAEILYIMSRNVREKAAEVRRDQKDVEIIEAHLFDLATSARGILRALGRSENSMGPDPVHTMSPNGHLDSDSLIRLADNIFYAVTEEAPDGDWGEIVEKALERFAQKVPAMDREAVSRIVTAVGQRFRRQNIEQQLAAAAHQ